MQDQTKKTKNKKRALVFKPYAKGSAFDTAALKRSLRVMAYFFMFAFLYVIAGSTLQFGNMAVRVVMNLLMVAVCAAVVYMDGARLGESEVAFGEIAYTRQQEGKETDAKDKMRCYHPLKGVTIALVAAIPAVLLTLPHALTAVKQTYYLQALPNWVSGYSNQAEVVAPLQFYARDVQVTVLDILRIVSRVLIFPFANIATVDNTDALLVMDRLSPVLACLPLIGFPLGYMTGPRARAMVHGDISSSNKRVQRKKKKAAKARQARAAKKNELI